jgi:hypothetical protein
MRILIMSCAVCLLSFAFVLFNASDRLEAAMTVPPEGRARIMAINQQMEALQGKFGVLLAESVEMRLKTLQRSIEMGKVSASDIAAFEQLKNDLTLLEDYAERSGANGLDGALLEHARFQQTPGSGMVRNEALMDEVLRVKNLLYFCAASLAATTVLISGYWLRQRSRTFRLHSEIAAVPMLAKMPGRDSGD